MMNEVRSGAPAVHGGLFLAVLAAVGLGLPALPWPWHLLLPLLVYTGVAVALPPLRRTAPRLTLGRMSGAPLACTILLSSTAAAVLVGFHHVVQPDVKALAETLPGAEFGNLVWAGVFFSVVNAVLEELVFRGLLWEVVAQEWNPALAVGVTAVLFGLGHMQGYPPGLLGAALAAIYGVAQGLLRWWAKGLGLAIASHVSVDATIFSLLVSTAG